MNVKIVAVEGLDGSGKSTFARKLYEAVSRNIPVDLEFGVIFQHFPDYDSPTGKEIKYRLKNGDFKSSKFLNELIHLFMANRYDWWVNNYWRFRKRYPMLVIVDRYRLSNLYTMLPRFEDCDTIGQLAQRIDYMNELEFNMHRVVKEDLDVVLWCPIDLRLQRLAERAERDLNETQEYVTTTNALFADINMLIDTDSIMPISAELMDNQYLVKNHVLAEYGITGDDYTAFYLSNIIDEINEIFEFKPEQKFDTHKIFESSKEQIKIIKDFHKSAYETCKDWFGDKI